MDTKKKNYLQRLKILDNINIQSLYEHNTEMIESEKNHKLKKIMENLRKEPKKRSWTN